jgi:error-prone DNA polymerase
MGFYSPSQLLQDACRHGIKVAPIDVNQSDWQHTLQSRNALEEPTLRLGFRLIKGLAQTTAQQIVHTRHDPANGQPRLFFNIEDIARRGSISTSNMALLGSAGALDSLTSHRRQAHWQILATEDRRPLLDAAPIDPTNKSHSNSLTATIPYSTDSGESRFTPLDEIQRLRADYSTTGVTLGRHPMQILRERFPRFERCKRHADLAALGHRRFVRIAGIVTGRQRPGTASGVIFLTLEDETGNSNIVIWKSVQQRCRQALLKAQLLMVKGVIETEGSVVHVIAQQLTDCSELLYETAIRSRDFH